MLLTNPATWGAQDTEIYYRKLFRHVPFDPLSKVYII